MNERAKAKASHGNTPRKKPFSVLPPLTIAISEGYGQRKVTNRWRVLLIQLATFVDDRYKEKSAEAMYVPCTSVLAGRRFTVKCAP